jgi:peptidoglycan/xylan/chitin deacetylase (PgdA/CDA1 family)
MTLRAHIRLTLLEMFWRLLRFFGWEITDIPRMTVLLYHSVSDSDDFHAVTPAAFASQIEYLKRYFDVVPLSRAFAHAAGKSVEKDSVAITFDDGYRDFIENAQPILERFAAPATLFVLGGEADRRELGNAHPLIAREDIPRINRNLVDVGSHGMTHKKLTRLSEEDAKREMSESRDRIAQTYGEEPDYFSYAKGAVNGSVRRLAEEAGYEGAVSVIQRGVHEGDDLFALPRMQVDSETTFRIFCAKLSIAADWHHALWSLVRGR